MRRLFNRIAAMETVTWIWHGWFSIAVPALLATVCAWVWDDPAVTFATYIGGTVAAAGYFLGIREPKDELKARLMGVWEKGDRELTKAVDMVGDSIGPAFVAGSAVMATAMFVWSRWLPMALVLASGLYVVLVTRRNLRKRG